MLPGTATLADGSGETIAIIDAFRSPNIVADLQAFDAQFGIPDLIGAAFTIVSQTGGSTNGLATDSSWNLETTLDVEIVHALAPGANILLVEANSNGAGDLQAAVKYARQQPGVVAISMSFGYGESSTDLTTNAIFTTPTGHQGETFIAATGDSGQPAAYPAYSPNVLAVGGTTLSVDSLGNYLGETGWSLNTPNEAATNASGGGISTIESQPAYQNGVVTQSLSMRTAPDVAFDGDPNTGASIYDSSDYGTANPWIRVGGTSLSAPAWAALIAIADQARASIGLGSLDGATQTLPTLYAAPSSDFTDITAGNNGYSAGPGYDLVTGLGTPQAAALVHDLVGPFQVAASTPANGAIVAAAPTDFAITFGSPYATMGIAAADLTVNGIPADSFDPTSPTTITFHFNSSPVTMQGLQTMSIDAGSLTRQADGSPLAAFGATFRYDMLPIAVDATTPVDGSIVTLPLTTLNVHFNEPYDPATIGNSDLLLSQGFVAGFSFVDSQTVQYVLSGVSSPGPLTVSMAAGAVTDPFGNVGPAYSGTLFLNGTATAFPTPLAQVNPAGSLIYQGSTSGAILFAGQTVSYTLAIAAGQTLSILVTPTIGLQPLIDLTGPGVNTSATATATGTPAILQTVSIDTTGTYTFTIGGANGSKGSYAIAAYLNAASPRRPTAGQAIRLWPPHRISTADSWPWPARPRGRQSSAGHRFSLDPMSSVTRPSPCLRNSTIFTRPEPRSGFLHRRKHYNVAGAVFAVGNIVSLLWNDLQLRRRQPARRDCASAHRRDGNEHRSVGGSDHRRDCAPLGQHHRQRVARFGRLLQGRIDEHRHPVGYRMVSRQFCRRAADGPGHFRGDPELRRHDRVQLLELRQQPAAAGRRRPDGRHQKRQRQRRRSALGADDRRQGPGCQQRRQLGNCSQYRDRGQRLLLLHARRRPVYHVGGALRRPPRPPTSRYSMPRATNWPRGIRPDRVRM